MQLSIQFFPNLCDAGPSVRSGGWGLRGRPPVEGDEFPVPVPFPVEGGRLGDPTESSADRHHREHGHECSQDTAAHQVPPVVSLVPQPAGGDEAGRDEPGQRKPLEGNSATAATSGARVGRTQPLVYVGRHVHGAEYRQTAVPRREGFGGVHKVTVLESVWIGALVQVYYNESILLA